MKKNIRIYADSPDPAAMNQFYEAMEAAPSAVQGAIMPDVHKGYSLPIGAVVATEGMVFPAWVGFDIGCGVLGVKTAYSKDDIINSRNEIFKRVYEVIPIGLGKNNKVPCYDWFSDFRKSSYTAVLKEIWTERRGDLQLGSLGSGNHFIEIGYDEDDKVWIIVHSGSRNIGHSTASYYMKKAAGGKKLEWHHGFSVDSEDGKNYITDLNFCLEFALENRLEIARNVAFVVEEFSHGFFDSGVEGSIINRNHNHAESKDGLWIHRKGATHAEDGMLGVIPGNMRDGSFIVKGKGNSDSLCSSSHGAGRVKSRGQAKREITLDTFQEQMQGITAKVDAKVLDESPDAYKNIFEVMAQQKDLVEVLHHIKPIINIKG